MLYGSVHSVCGTPGATQPGGDQMVSPINRLRAVVASASLLLWIVSASAVSTPRIGARGISSGALSDALPRDAGPQNSTRKASAAEGSASVAGTVVDVRGAAIPGADVSLAHGDGTQLQTMVSEANGEFNFTKILPGPYLVVVNAKGFALFTSAEFVSRCCRPMRFRMFPYRLRRQTWR
jgi:hypothetical protein